MKKLYLMLAFMTFGLMSAINSQAQTLSNVSIYDSCAGVQVYVNTSANASNITATIFWGDGTDSTETVVQRSAFFHKKYNSQGTYTVKTILYKNGNPIDSNTQTFVADCSIMKLRAYMDNNSNCSKANNEPILRTPLQVEVDSAGVIIDTVTLRGQLWYFGKAGIVYKFKVLNGLLGGTLTCPSNGVNTLTAPYGQGSYVDFGYNCSSTTQFDLGVQMAGRFRPVNTSRLIVHAYNRGCGAKNGVLTVHLSNKYKYKNANIAPTTINGNILIWNLAGLSALNTKTIYIEADTATKVTLNDTVCNYATITPISGDANTTNNTVNQCDSVRASWDPNDKGVYPSGDIMPGTKLTYTINFENLGNDTAFNIHILDTLSDNVDVNSFELLNSSHDVSALFVQNSINKNILRFDFADIYLPYTNAPNHNKGFVTFSINAKQSLQPLTKINNQAAIYFDINPPIITNIAENRIAPVGISSINVTEDIRMYPNPVTDVLTVQTESSKYSKIKMFNNIGQTLLQQNININTTQIDMKHLPTGIYYIQLQGDAGIITKKIEKL